MDETAVFEGRPLNGLIAHTLLGSVTGCLGALFLRFTALNKNLLPPGIIFSVLAIAFLAIAAMRLRKRQVIVDRLMISYQVGSSLRWTIPWIQIKSVGNRLCKGGASTFCIYLKIDGGEALLTDGTDFGPRKKFLALFVHLASRARERRLSVEDHLGWLAEARHPPRSFADRLSGTWQLELPESLRTADYSNKWLECNDHASPVLIAVLLLVSSGPVVAAVCIFVIMGTMPLWFASIGVLIPAILLGAIVLLVNHMEIVKLSFDGKHITLQRNTGRRIDIPWSKVKRCRYDTDYRTLEIFSDKGNYQVTPDFKSILAICKGYTEATGRPAHIYYSNRSNLSSSYYC